jgi:hypothetical protein
VISWYNTAMRHSTRPFPVLTGILASALTLGLPAASAAPVGIDLPGGRYVISCDTAQNTLLANAAPLAVNGARLTCSQFTGGDTLTIAVGIPTAGTAAKIDARGLPFGLTVIVANPSTVQGSAFDDTIYLGGGRVSGNGGNDKVFALPASGDTAIVSGGAGDDVIACGSYTAAAEANPGRCELTGGDGNDVLSLENSGVGSGGNGDDQVLLGIGVGTKSFDGGAGNDAALIRPTFEPTAGVFGKLIVTPGASPYSLKIDRISSISTTVNVETANLFMTPRSNKLTLDNEVTFNVYSQDGASPSGAPPVVTIRVPGGVWTQTPDAVIAPGLKPANFPAFDPNNSTLFPFPPSGARIVAG